MNDTSIVTITALAHDGRGIAKADPTTDNGGQTGPVIFVPGALPGEVVRIVPERRKARLVEARLLEVLQPAPDAVPALCPHQAVCGGCPLQTMPYASQLQWKERLALDALARIGRLPDLHFDVLHAAPALREFRNKMEFAFGPDPEDMPDHDAGPIPDPEYAHGNNLLLGLRRRGGREVTAVPGCVLLPAEAAGLLAAARDIAAGTPYKAYLPPADGRKPKTAGAEHGFWRFLILRQGRTAQSPAPRWWALCITSPGTAEQRAAVRRLGKELAAAFPALAGFVHEERGRADALAQGERRICTLNPRGENEPQAAVLHLPLAGRLFALDIASFFQVNTEAAQLLAAEAVRMLSAGDCENRAGHTAGATTFGSPHQGGLLDLYCGVGAPGLAAAHLFPHLLGLERDPRAVALARRNAADVPHCRYESGDTALLPRLKAKARTGAGRADSTGRADTAALWDTVLLDPPRAGLSPETFKALTSLKARQIVYISCNPATLARDAALLTPHYALTRLAGVDLFPHTAHLECLTLWQRR